MLVRIAALLLPIFSLLLGIASAQADENPGQVLSFDRSKGNCLACHAFPGNPAAKSAGNIGPPLMSMKSRYPDRAKLRAQIWDATARNPHTSMPPFGKNKILTEPEIDQVVDFVMSQ
jgi:L-cysteine S-thiosulfotransferase